MFFFSPQKTPISVNMSNPRMKPFKLVPITNFIIVGVIIYFGLLWFYMYVITWSALYIDDLVLDVVSLQYFSDDGPKYI